MNLIVKFLEHSNKDMQHKMNVVSAACTALDPKIILKIYFIMYEPAPVEYT